MKIAILTIGNEILRGSTTNTNLADIGRRLMEEAIFPEMEIAIPDTEKEIGMALGFLLSNYDVIISTGGLGPTSDDITRKAICDYLGIRLLLDKGIAENLMTWWLSFRRAGPPPESMISQAYVPEGAEVMPNRNGTAPGLHISYAPKLGDRHIFMLPGPPAEALPMFESSVIPALRRLAPSSLHTEILYSAGLPESKLEERVVAITGAPREISLAYCASPESVKIFVSSEDRECARKHADSIRMEMSAHILSHGSRTIAEEILKVLSAKGLTLSVAESCTGGLIASEITEIAGSSSVFKGGAVTYSNSLKNSILGVGERTLLEHGAVSAECARQMAAGAAAKFASDTAIAVTGIAGPGGGSEEKPIGLVFIATSVGKDIVVTENRFRGNRSMIRRRSVATAFNQIRIQLSA